MPEIKNYDKKKHQVKDHVPVKGHHKKHANKRRPHHEEQLMMPEADEAFEETTEVTVEAKPTSECSSEADAINTEAQNEGVAAETEQQPESEQEAYRDNEQYNNANETTEEHKIHLKFLGSNLLREKAPKVMELAETVADEWVHDGKFEGLPVGNPLAQIAAAKALRTAKDVEKKLDEKGVFTMAKIGVDYLKSKIEKKK